MALETLPETVPGRSIYKNVIPTVCSLKNMLKKLHLAEGDTAQLESWHRRSYNAYNIEAIQNQILGQPETVIKNCIQTHILKNFPNGFGSSCVDIYLVGYVANTFEPGGDALFQHLHNHGVTKKINSMNAI